MRSRQCSGGGFDIADRMTGAKRYELLQFSRNKEMGQSTELKEYRRIENYAARRE